VPRLAVGELELTQLSASALTQTEELTAVPSVVADEVPTSDDMSRTAPPPAQQAHRARRYFDMVHSSVGGSAHGAASEGLGPRTGREPQLPGARELPACCSAHEEDFEVIGAGLNGSHG
jgi:hypothetical protein